MATSIDACVNEECENHFHAYDPIFTVGGTKQQSQTQLLQQQNSPSEAAVNAEKKQEDAQTYDRDDHGFRRIIRNFTPSYAPYRL